MSRKQDPGPEQRWKGVPALGPLLRPVGSLHPDPANVRRHPERNLTALRASLARFGQQRPVLIDADGVIRAGNGTYQAALELGWTHLAAVPSDLKGSEATAYALADNRTAELAEWDYEGLAGTLRALDGEGFDLGGLGWAEHELEPLLAAEWEPPALGDLPGGEDGPDDPPPGDDPATIELTAEQRRAFEAALPAVRDAMGEPDAAEGRCVAWLADAFRAGR